MFTPYSEFNWDYCIFILINKKFPVIFRVKFILYIHIHNYKMYWRKPLKFVIFSKENWVLGRWKYFL